MKKLIFALSVVGWHFSSFSEIQVNPTFLAGRVASYVLKNQVLKKPKKYKREWKTMAGEKFAIKILNLLEAGRPEDKRAHYQVLVSLIRKFKSPSKDLRERLYSGIKLVKDEDYRNWLFKLLDESVLRKLPPEKKPETRSKQDGLPINSTITNLKKAIRKLPGQSKFEKNLTKALTIIEDMLIGDISDDDCYQNDPDCQFDGNDGLIRYFSKRLAKDHELYFAVLKVGIYLSNLKEKIAPPKPSPTTSSSINIWPKIVKLVGNKKLALHAITVFGHDVCCNSLWSNEPHDWTLGILNSFSTSRYGGDSDPKSWLYVPGVISGLNIKKKRIKKLLQAKKHYEKLAGIKEKPFRAGFHHVYGGMLTASRLLEENVATVSTLNLAQFVAQSLGFMYKYTQTPNYLSKNAALLWKQVNYSFNTPHLELPSKWPIEKFEIAKAELEYFIEIIRYTEAQHVAGARFAYQIYRE